MSELSAQAPRPDTATTVASGRRLFWQGVVLALLVATAQYSYLLFHSLAEIYSIVIACGIFFIAWNAREHYHNDYLLFIGIAYLFVAFFDTLHTLGYHGMPVFADFPGYNLGPQLWLVGRSLEACTLLAAPLFIRRPLRCGTVLAIYGLVALAALWSIFAARNFPVCFTPESGLSAFKIGAEYAIIAVLLAALTLLVRHRREFDRGVYRLLVASIVLTVASELCFTLYISHYGPANLLGHLCKIVSFTLIYYAIVETALRRPFALLFRDVKERQEGMLAAQRAARLGSWSWRPGNHEMAWTPEVYRQLGLTPEGVRPTMANFLAALPNGARSTLQQDLETLHRDGTAFRREVTLETDAGEPRYLRIKGTRTMDENGAPLLAGVVQDVTEQVVAERLREDMDSIVRHDLRSPLTPIIAFPELLIATGKNLTAEQLDMLSHIRLSGLKMLDMLNSSLTLYKIEQGSYQLQPDLFDLLATLRQVLRELEPKAGERHVACHLLYDQQPPATGLQVPCFAEQLLCHTLFANLLGNAIEAAPPHSAVTVAVGASSGDWRIAIANQGEVPEPVRPRFFDKYTTFGKKGGTGLGTYSALLAARAHGGTILLDTGSGVTTLTVVLPKPEEFQAIEAEIARGAE